MSIASTLLGLTKNILLHSIDVRCFSISRGPKPDPIMQRGVFMGIAISIIISFFAVYGVLQLIAKGVFLSRARCGCQPAYVHRLIGVRDCEDSVEGMVRSLAWEDIREELIVIDLGSTDETGEILRRLEGEYDFLHVMTPAEYRAYIADMAAACM